MKALQRVVKMAQKINSAALPAIQDICTTCCLRKTKCIIKGSGTFLLVPSGKQLRDYPRSNNKFRDELLSYCYQTVQQTPICNVNTEHTVIFKESFTLFTLIDNSVRPLQYSLYYIPSKWSSSVTSLYYCLLNMVYVVSYHARDFTGENVLFFNLLSH